MTRDDIAWIIVRAFGVYFAYQVLAHLFGIAIGSANMMYMYSVIGNMDEIPAAMESTRRAAWLGIYAQLARVLIGAFIAYYCFCRGKFVHRLLTRELPTAKQTFKNVIFS